MTTVFSGLAARRAARGLVVLLLAVCVTLGLGHPSLGQTENGDSTLTWSVRPTPTDAEPERPNFSFDAEPGATISDSIRVRNYGPDPLPLVIYASDALTTPTGALDLLAAGEVSTDVGLWITLESSSLVVPGGGFVDVPFTLVVPANAESGDHTGGIVTSFVATATSDTGQPVVVDRRLGSRVQVRVAGEITPALEVSQLQVAYRGTANPFGAGSLQVAYTVTNTGNVRLAAGQEIRVDGALGLPGRVAVMTDMPELLPGNSLEFTADVSGVWPTIRPAVTLELTPRSTRAGEEGVISPVSTTTTLWVVPWPQLVLLLLAAGVPLLVWRSRRRRRRRYDDTMRQAVQTAVLVQEALQAALAARGDRLNNDPEEGSPP